MKLQWATSSYSQWDLKLAVGCFNALRIYFFQQYCHILPIECHLMTQQDTRNRGAPRKSHGVAEPCATRKALDLGSCSCWLWAAVGKSGRKVLPNGCSFTKIRSLRGKKCPRRLEQWETSYVNYVGLAASRNATQSTLPPPGVYGEGTGNGIFPFS